MDVGVCREGADNPPTGTVCQLKDDYILRIDFIIWWLAVEHDIKIVCLLIAEAFLIYSLNVNTCERDFCVTVSQMMAFYDSEEWYYCTRY